MLFALLALGVVLALEHLQFAPLASRVASQALGRKVTIDSLRVTLESVVSVDLSGLVIANAPGASRPTMVEIKHLRVEIVPISLLRRDPVIRRLSVEGARLILEHGQNDRANWKFGGGPAAAGPPSAAGPRASVPIVLEAGLADAEIDFRTSSGALLHFRLDKLAGNAAGRDAPMTVTAVGAYNNLPVRAGATLAPFAVLRDGAKPYGVDLRLDSGQTVIDFKGGMTDPLNFDGIEGRLVLNGPDPGSLPAIAQIPAALNVPVTFAAAASRHGNVWTLSNGVGAFDGHPFQATIALTEAPRRSSDSLTIDARFRTLDLRGIAPGGQGRSVGSPQLMIDPAPGTLVDAHIAADQVLWRRVTGQNLDLTLSLRPGVLTVGPVTLGIAGGVATSHTRVMNGQADANGQAGADIMFDGGLTGVDAQSLASLLGLGAIPLTGAIDSRFSGGASGADLAAARNSSRGFAILSMAGGTIDRRLVRLASTDLRVLFGRGGAGKLSCLLAILNLRDGVGAIAPFRLKTPNATITGGGLYDFRRDYIDMTVGSQSASTGFFALDIPVRISGPLSDYSVRPAIGAAARQLNATGDLDDIPGPMMDFARGNPCMNARR